MKKKKKKTAQRERRKKHIRIRIKGTAERPRITVFKSNLHLYAQAIDDKNGTTLCSASTLDKEFKNLKNNAISAQMIGEALGKKMMDKNIQLAVFDRNGYKYHGVIKALADGARKVGVKF